MWQSSLTSFSTSILGKATISNDGATILKLLDVVHPAAKTLVDIAKSQDAEVGGWPGCTQEHNIQQQACSCRWLCGNCSRTAGIHSGFFIDVFLFVITFKSLRLFHPELMGSLEMSKIKFTFHDHR